MRTRLASVFAITLTCYAQRAAAPAPPAPAAMQLGGISVTGSFRTRAEGWQWFKADTADSDYWYSGNIARISFSQSKETWDWTAEFALPFLLGLPDNAVASGTQGALGAGANYYTSNDRNRNSAMLFPKQLYFRLNNFAGAGHSLKIGRFEFNDGTETTPKNAALATLKNTRINQRILGTFGWTHVGRSFDGFHYAYAKPSGNFTFVGAVPTRGVFQTDGWGWNRAALGYASYTKPWGTSKHSADTRAFALFYDDFRHILKTDNRPSNIRQADMANIKIASFGGHSVHAFTTASGTIDLLFWGVGQTGRWGTQDHSAGALDIEAGIQPAILPSLKPWFRGGFYWGSGDGNPNDDEHETFFQVLPTPRPFARFPFYNLMNNRDLFGMVTLRPHPKVTITNEFHAMRLSASSDLWYQGGGVYQPWTFGYIGRSSSGRRSFANLYDTNIEYRANPKLTLTGYFGYAQGLATMSFIYPNGKDGKMGYIEALYRF